jgi:hypothetical protein
MVAVTRKRRQRTVPISAYACLRLKRRDREVWSLDDFTADDVAALETTRAPDAAKAFDSELT